MADSNRIVWHDLTVPDAESLKDFYAGLLGVPTVPTDMDGYNDHTLMDGENPIGGVCHARGMNAAIPPVWLVYFRVDNLDAATQFTVDKGGEIISGPHPYGEEGYAIVRDPADVVFAVYGPTSNPAE